MSPLCLVHVQLKYVVIIDIKKETKHFEDRIFSNESSMFDELYYSIGF